MSTRLLASTLILCIASASTGFAAKKKKKSEEETTQTLEVLKDPPAAVAADASKLVFFVSPLSAKGLLSQQIRDALKNLLGQTRGAQIVKLRAFVAGSGDLRRVPALVSEIFTDKRLALPAVTVVQAGALPLTGAQVLFEAMATEKKPVNPNGLVFLAAQNGTASDAGRRLTAALNQTGLKADSVRQISCFLDSLDYEGEVRGQIAAAFPRTPALFIQLRRDSSGDFTACQAVGALGATPDQNASIPNASAAVGPVRVVLTGTQMAFGREDQDVRLALERLGKALESAGASWRSVVTTNTYALSNGVSRKVAEVRRASAAPGTPVPDTALVFEGLPSLDATFAIEAVAFAER